MRIRLLAMSLALLCFGFPRTVHAQATSKSPEQYRAEVLALSSRIDQLIAARWKEAGIVPAPRSENGKFFRRLSLDLTGKIPDLLLIVDYLDPTWAKKDDDVTPYTTAARTLGLLASPHGRGYLPAGGVLAARGSEDLVDKRWEFVERMLSEESYGRHFANMWRSLILAGNNNMQAQFFQVPFENWMRQHLHNNTPYDKIVYDLLTASPSNNVNQVSTGMGGASPAAFYFANENKPENLAGATTRMFLGVKLECAQCHAHPFAKWTRNQFWEFAAFFGGIQQNVRPGGGIQPAALQGRGREIAIPGTDKTVKAKFLNGAEPSWKDGVDSRAILADWITAADNPFFAKAAVDHLWSYFFGVSLLEPIYEPNEDHPVVHTELVDEMARHFIAQKFDVKFLIRAIVHTEAYQRTSEARAKDVNRDDIFFFARMPVRGLSPEQIFDSVAEATQYRQPAVVANPNQQFFNGPMTPRAEFVQKFTNQEKKHETQTSILQALFLMNGKFLGDQLRHDSNSVLQNLAQKDYRGGNPQKVDTLYRIVLSRPPRPEEAARFIHHLERNAEGESHRRALTDIYWVLLNSGEFLLNH